MGILKMLNRSGALALGGSNVRTGRIFGAMLAASLMVFMSACGGTPHITTQTVTVAPASASSALQAGSDSSVIVSNVSAGDLSAASTTITFTSSSGASASRAGSVAAAPASTFSTQATNVISNGNGSFQVFFQVPLELYSSNFTSFNLTVNGTTTAGKSFSSSNPVVITVTPPSTITVLLPNSAQQGTTVDVAITAANSNFVQGTTKASFGAGTSVAGGPDGQLGLVTVNSATTATAHVSVSGAATLGNRDVKMQTTGQKALLAAGFHIVGVNRPPVARANGPYAGTAGQAVTFSSAGSSDPDGDPLTFSWNFGDNTALGTGASPSHTFATAGVYVVALTVSDGRGGNATSNATATIAAVNRPPVANPGGPYTGIPGSPIQFTGSASSDPDGDTLSFAWNFGDGGSSTQASPTYTYANAGTFTVSLTVSDGRGGSNTATTTATTSAVNHNPIAAISGPYTGTPNQAVAFNASGSSDPDGDTLSYAWDFGDSSTGTGATPSHTYTAAGTYTVTLAVTDGRGGSATATTSAVITAGNNNPVANAGGPYTGTTNQAVTFNGAGSTDADGDTLTYAWDFGDSTTGTGSAPTHTYTTANTFTVSLTVTDGRGGSNTATTTATIQRSNVAPVANAGANQQGNVSQVLTFDGSASSDADSDPLTYAWDFGDGATATGATATHAYTAAGQFSARLTVNDGSLSNSATITVTITQPATVKITSPAANDLFNTASVNVSGTVDRNDVTVDVNGVAATVSNNNFSAQGVQLREGVNLITATATDNGGNAGSDVVSVALDVTPPVVRIDSPAESSVVTSAQINVTGMINDIVTGTVNAEQVTVTVNGIAATVANRSFSVSDLLLVRGMNEIRVVARDRAGNESSATTHVDYEDTTSDQRIMMVSGNNQSDVIGATLQQPLIVMLVNGDQSPAVGRAVTFSVRRSDGIIKALPEEGQELTVVTDDSGTASVLMQLGSRSGVGVNEVSAVSPGFVGEVVFSASSTVAPPDRIQVVRGENQRGIVGQTLPHALEVIVIDRGGNPLENVPVNFTVEQGGGTLDGQSARTVNTNSDGKAAVVLTLGQQEGINNNIVSANFDGNSGSGVSFTSTGSGSGPVANTSVSGVVLDDANTPIPNATVKLMGTTLTTVTNADGQFQIPGAPVGTVTLSVDGSTSTRPETFPFLSFLLRTVSGQDNTLNMPIYLPQVDTENSQTVGGDQPVTLTMRGVPGVAFTVAPNSATFPDGSHVGRLSLSQVKADMVPMAPPNGSAPKVVWTLQPAGARFDPPISVQLPNTDGLAPGQVVEIYQFDHDLEQFVSGGTARVSPDGSVLTTDAGFGLSKAGWGGSAPPPPPKNCTISCDDSNECTADSVQNPPCSCAHSPSNNGGACGGKATGTDSCTAAGTCQGGSCSGAKKPDGTSCDDDKFCTENDACGGGACKGTPVADREVPIVPSAEVNLGSLFTPIENLAKKYTGQGNFSITLSNEAKLTYICCETKKLHDAEKRELKYGLNGKLEMDKTPIPGYSIGVPGAFIGLYWKAGVAGQVAITGTNDLCADQKCFTGSIGLSGTIEFGAAVEANPSIISASLNGSTGPTMEASIGCGEVKYKVGISELKAKGTVELADGAFTYNIEYTLIPATNLFEGSIPLN